VLLRINTTIIIARPWTEMTFLGMEILLPTVTKIAEVGSSS